MSAEQDIRPDSRAPGDAGPSASDLISDPGWRSLILLFLLLLGVYHANSAVTHVNDITPSVATAISLVTEGNTTLTPNEFPRLFLWSLDLGEGPESIEIADWRQSVRGVPAGERLASGEIHLTGHPYYLIASLREGEYVSRYGLGAVRGG